MSTSAGNLLQAPESTRTYRGRTVDELIPSIQQELGADAIILRRREGLTGGILGFFQHPFVEIEAMPGGPSVDLYDEDEVAFPSDPAPAPERTTPVERQRAPAYQPAPDYRAAPAPAPAPRAAPAPQAAFQQGAAPHYEPQPERQWAPEQRPAPPPRPTFQYRPAQPAPPEPQRQQPPMPMPMPMPTSMPTSMPRPSLERQPAPAPFPPRELPPPRAPGSAYVTAHLAALARASRSQIGEHESAPIPPRDPPARVPDFGELIQRPRQEPFVAPLLPPPPPPAAQRPPPERRTVAPGSHARARAGVERSLLRFGVSEGFARELIDGASAHALPLAPRAGLAQAVRVTLAQRIPVAAPLPTQGAAIVVVGTGGAGKTTCCSALLGAYRKSSTLPASCATLTRDSERGALQMILSPYVMKPTPPSNQRALRALRRSRGEGLALLDTPRLSPADRAGIRELAHLLGELKPERVVVALPATLGATAAAQLLAALKPLGASSVAVTHADETDQLGVAVEAACRFDLAPEYLLDRGRSGGWRLSRVDPTGLAAKLLP
jgi:flagellar biosynthesis GTPase FlhF